jgi:hypothetical protein
MSVVSGGCCKCKRIKGYLADSGSLFPEI